MTPSLHPCDFLLRIIHGAGQIIPFVTAVLLSGLHHELTSGQQEVITRML